MIFPDQPAAKVRLGQIDVLSHHPERARIADEDIAVADRLDRVPVLTAGIAEDAAREHLDVSGLDHRVRAGRVTDRQRHGIDARVHVPVLRVLFHTVGRAVAEVPVPGVRVARRRVHEQRPQWRDADGGRAREVGDGRHDVTDSVNGTVQAPDVDGPAGNGRGSHYPGPGRESPEFSPVSRIKRINVAFPAPYVDYAIGNRGR
ncbi:MAG: hypothetical protein A4E28_00234 [Methanocella sp. PtaU1.Bin125]|nr:MAG: hypothetical protein A4E28_00234 [Methanocella sp. PtaU1.Bin125]